MPRELIELTQGVGISVVGVAALFAGLVAIKMIGVAIDKVMGWDKD